jgi:hypothetical protein
MQQNSAESCDCLISALTDGRQLCPGKSCGGGAANQQPPCKQRNNQASNSKQQQSSGGRPPRPSPRHRHNRSTAMNSTSDCGPSVACAVDCGECSLAEITAAMDTAHLALRGIIDDADQTAMDAAGNRLANACAAIVQVATPDSDTEAAVAAAGGAGGLYARVMESVDAFADNPSVQEQCHAAFDAVKAVTFNCNDIDDTGTCACFGSSCTAEQVVAAMNAFPRDRVRQGNGCLELETLAMASTRDAAAIEAAGGEELVTKAINAFADDDEVKSNCQGAATAIQSHRYDDWKDVLPYAIPGALALVLVLGFLWWRCCKAKKKQDTLLPTDTKPAESVDTTTYSPPSTAS